jgi:hypothetical protein
MAEELADFLAAQLARMASAVETDVAENPLDISLASAKPAGTSIQERTASRRREGAV